MEIKMNILTYDIEEWYVEKVFHGNHKEKYAEYDECLDKILAKLDETHTKGTFFCVGGMAREFPDVLKRIASNGHEIGCHSDRHTWLNKMSREEVEEDTHKAIDSLRQCTGQDVVSYRAPAFSVGKSNPWAFEILYKNGIRCDSSVFPAERDFGGFPDYGMAVPSIVSYNGCKMKEFPICMTNIIGKNVVYSGGGYFRIFPYFFLKNTMKRADYAISYFHINDLLKDKLALATKSEYEEYFKEEASTTINRLMRYFKSNIGKKGALDKMNKLVDTMKFVNIAYADAVIDWNKVPVVEL